MRIRFLFALSLIATSAVAADRWIAIAGTVNNFHTDTRVFNPSATKDIEISAYFLPVGVTNNNERIAAPPVKFALAKRQMRVLDDVVTSLFSATGLGAIMLTSSDDFIATSRIYAIVAAGTLGQFSDALAPSLALSKGVLLQLKSNASFRTNIGFANPANASTTITFRLYDKANALVATVPMTVAAYEVKGPTNVSAIFPGVTADLSDAWVSFTSTNPIFAYASVIDQGTTDPTLINAQTDTGETITPPAETKVFDVSLASFLISVSPELKVSKGDKVKFRVRAVSGTHGFQLLAPNGTTLIPSGIYVPGDPAVEFNFTASDEGTYSYFCTNASCGELHDSMLGSFTVGKDSDPGHGY
ncbi:MAG TPA: hypothetical protein VMU84_07125 [Thermoanaerobaculia bacterium]|nr:hypothetical protein [Thermoanaerobaculia bacterium]